MRGRSALVALLALLALLASPGTSVAAAPSGGVRTSAARRWLQKRGGAIDDAIVIPFDDAAHHALDDDVDARAAEWKKNHTAPPPSPLAPPAKNPSDGPVGARVETCKPRAVAKAKRCHYVRHNPACSKDENIVPYLTIHYCHMRRLATLSTALQLSLAVFFISVMAIVAERFFVPSLENVSRALRLPEDVAGATVLSFGNGAPDVFTQVAAFKGADAEGVSLALGAVFGAGFYVCAVVLPAVVLLTGKKPEAKSPSTIAAATRGKGIRRGLLGGGGDDDDDASDAYDDDDDDETDETDETLTLTRRRGAFHRIAECMSLNHGVDVGKAAFTRDVGFYGAAVATTFGIFLAGDVNAPHAIALGSMYAAYLIALLAPARVRAMLRGLGWGVAPGAAAAFSAEDDLAAAADGEGLTAGLLDADESFEDGYAALIEDGTGVGGAPNVRWGGGGAGSTNGGAGIDENDAAGGGGGGVAAPPQTTLSPSRMLRKTLSALAAIVNAPTLFALRCTMPELNADASRQSRVLVSALPVTAPLFFIAAERFLPNDVNPAGAIYGAACGALGAVALYAAWPTLIGPDAPRAAVRAMTAALTIVAFAQSITWMDVVAGEIVALLAAVGTINGLSESLLGATVLAWGISIGDLVSNVTVAKEGHPRMAVAACVGGPMFNVLVGLSLGMFSNVSKSGRPLRHFKLHNDVIVLVASLLIALVYLFLSVVVVNRGRITRATALGVLFFYAGTQAVYVLTSMDMIFKTPWLR